MKTELHPDSCPISYSLLYEENPLILFVIDADGTVRSINKVGAAHLGYTPEELVGKSVFGIFYEEDRALVADQVRDALGNPGEVRQWEVRKVRKDGSRIWVRESARLFETQGGSCILMSCEDITERKKAEQISEQLSLAVEHAGMGAWSADFQTGESIWAPVVFEILGYDPAKVRPATDFWRECVHPDDLAGELADLEKCRTNKVLCHNEYRIRRADNGEIRWLDSYKRFLYDESGRPVRLIGVFFDVTDRKRGEEARRATEAQYRTIFNLASVGMAQVELQTGRILRVNDQYCEITGYPREELLAMTVRDLTHPGDRQTDWARFMSMVNGEVPEYRAEKRYVRKNGEVIWVYVGARAIPSEQGPAFQSIGIIMDITDRKLVQTEIETLNADLRRRAEELERAYQDLESFTYAVSHDLKAPVIRIKGFSEMLTTDYSATLDDAGRDLLGRISENADNMKLLIDDLLNYSRLDAHSVNMTRIDMAELMKQAYEEARSAEGEREISFELRDMPQGYGDPVLIRQVALNLLANALKFTRDRKSAVIEAGGEIRDGEAMYYVRDNGIGYDMQFQEKLFGLFQRIHRGKRFEGTGVGLVIVKKIIERHGGRVWSEGSPGEGAVFCFTLPGSGRQG